MLFIWIRAGASIGMAVAARVDVGVDRRRVERRVGRVRRWQCAGGEDGDWEAAGVWMATLEVQASM